MGVRNNGKSAALGHLLQIRRQRHSSFFLSKRGIAPRMLNTKNCGYFTHQRGRQSVFTQEQLQFV